MPKPETVIAHICDGLGCPVCTRPPGTCHECGERIEGTAHPDWCRQGQAKRLVRLEAKLDALMVALRGGAVGKWS